MAKIKRYKYILWFSIIFIIISIFVLYYLKLKLNQEGFENIVELPSSYDLSKIDYYVITMGQQKRLDNINKQTAKLNSMNPGDPITITKIDAVKGDDLDLVELVKDGKITKEIITEYIYYGMEKNIKNRKYEVGCHGSHMKTYKTISDGIKNNKIDKNGYSIYFEDDFEIQDNYFEELQKAIDYLIKNEIDFDMLFLGIKSEKNDFIGSNIYKPICTDTYSDCWFAHAILINNSKIDKIIDKLSFMYNAIDIMMFDLSEKKQLNIYRIMPNIVNQNSPTTGSFIRDY